MAFHYLPFSEADSMITPQDYFQSTKPRKPMGANTLQPIGSSGVPGTANQQPLKQPANHRGVSKVGLSSQSLYGPPTSSQQAARDYGQQQQRPAQVNYAKPTVSNPYGQSPELDRWTGMGVDASDYHNLKAGNVSPKEWEGIKSNAIEAHRNKLVHPGFVWV